MLSLYAASKPSTSTVNDSPSMIRQNRAKWDGDSLNRFPEKTVCPFWMRK